MLKVVYDHLDSLEQNMKWLMQASNENLFSGKKVALKIRKKEVILKKFGRKKKNKHVRRDNKLEEIIEKKQKSKKIGKLKWNDREYFSQKDDKKEV